MTDDMYEVLQAVWCHAEAPGDYVKLAIVAGLPPEAVLACLREGLITKAGRWAVPKLTEKGRARLRGWRTCHDCHQECVESVHHCPARLPATPYRHAV